MHSARISLILAVLLSGASAAAAPTPPPVSPEASDAEAATRLRQQGNEAMLAMRYSDALGLYKQALALAPKEAGLHYSVARAHQFLGEYPEALTSLERFQREASPEALAKVGQLDSLFAQIRPRVSVLELACDVAGARVLVGDKVIGTTPLPATRLLAGATTIAVELEGYFRETRDVTLPGQGKLAMTIALHKKSTSGLLLVKSELGASVLLDGRTVGTSNPTVELSLAAGPHDVAVHKEGYVDARVPVVLEPGARRVLSIPLERPVPVTSRWWFWTGAAVVVAGGIAAAVALTTERSASQGSLTPGQISAP